VFNYNKFGHALVGEIGYNGCSQYDWTSILRFPAPKLRFNPVSREIPFGRVVCANVVPMVAEFSVYTTERCKLRSSIRDYGDEGPCLETVTMEVREAPCS